MIPQNIGDIIIRRATNQDQERIIALVFSVLNEYGLQPDPESTDSDLKDIEGNYLKQGGVFEVIEDIEGNLLGTAGLYPIDNRTCELRKMYLVPQARGRGLGKYILERAIGHARRLGFKIIILETASVLKEAIRLYTQYGFQPVHRDHLAPRADQAYFLDISH